MKQYVGRLTDVIHVLLYDRVVVVNAVGQQVFVRSEVTVHQAHRTAVNIEPYTDSAFISLEQQHSPIK